MQKKHISNSSIAERQSPHTYNFQGEPGSLLDRLGLLSRNRRFRPARAVADNREIPGHQPRFSDLDRAGNQPVDAQRADPVLG